MFTFPCSTTWPPERLADKNVELTSLSTYLYIVPFAHKSQPPNGISIDSAIFAYDTIRYDTIQ